LCNDMRIIRDAAIVKAVQLCVDEGDQRAVLATA